MQQIEDWLKNLGLSEYAQRFSDNAIEVSILTELTDADLRELGVLLGHRRKMLRAIGELRDSSTVRMEAPSEPMLVDRAERRQLSVMFSDLVGSTALSASMDPEDFREIISAYQQTVAKAVRRFDGVVAKYMGDGVLVYFGYPKANEDDAERAVRAALELIPEVAAIKMRLGPKLQVRIGIATGLVVVGDLVGEGAAQEQAVVGDTPNLASRLQGLALPGTVVIAASTRRLVGNQFRIRDLGRHELKGLAEPVEACVVEGLSAAESRFAAVRTAQLTDFIGREQEMRLLRALTTAAWQGEGKIVLIAGEAGIGKSRLTAWLSEATASEPRIQLSYQCSNHHSNSALYPFIVQIERAAQIEHDERPERRLEKLESLLAIATNQVTAAAPLFATLLSIPFAQRYPALNMSAAQQRRQTLAALLDQLEGLARTQPVLFVFEDAHWADATSLELLDLAIDRMRNLPVLAIITFRPEFEPPWAGLPHVTALPLGRLERQHVARMAQQVSGGRSLPTEVLDQIVAKTDGVPLFVEELTKMVLEAGILVAEGERYRVEGPLPMLAIPATLQDSLTARLDHLAPVKQIAQVGAAIGRQFSYALLSAVVGRDESALRDGLAQLEEAQLVLRRGEPPEATYTFKHALVQDAAYESLLKSRRLILHRRIAETLLERFPNIAESEPDVIAHHFTRAESTEEAVLWLGKAGERALRSSALAEAIAHFEAAISLGDRLVDDPPHRLARLRLQIAYGNALVAGRGYSVPETTAAFARARQLAAGIEDATERFAAYYGLCAGSYVRAELGPMLDFADIFFREVRDRPDTPEAGIAHRLSGVTCWFKGEYEEAVQQFEAALAACNPERDHALSRRFGQDIGISAMAYFPLVLWPSALSADDVHRSRSIHENATAQAHREGDPHTIAYAHFFGFCHRAMCGELAQAASHASFVIRLGREHGMQFWLWNGMFQEGWSRWHAGDREAGERGMRDGMALLREQGVRVFAPFYETLMAEIDAQSGRVSEALARLDAAIADVDQTGQRFFEAEMHRQRGEMLLQLSSADESIAEAAFRQALCVARSQRASAFELRAALSLAKLHRAKGENIEAQSVLAPAFARFGRRNDLPEVAEARHVLSLLTGCG